MSIASVEAELAQLEKRATVLRDKLRKQRSQKLTQLPEAVGLKTVDGLIAELTVHASAPLRAVLRPYFVTADLSAERMASGLKNPRGHRLSEEEKARLRADLENGLKSNHLIAVENCVSAATVSKMKRELGLARKTTRKARVGNGAVVLGP